MDKKKKLRKCPSGCGEMAVENLCCLDEGDNCFVCGYSFPYQPKKSSFEQHKAWRLRECPGNTAKFFKAIGIDKTKAWEQS